MAWFINGRLYRSPSSDITVPPPLAVINPPCAVCGAEQTHLIVLRDGPDYFVHGLCEYHYQETEQAVHEATDIEERTGDPDQATQHLILLAEAHWAEHEAIFGVPWCGAPVRSPRTRRHRSHEVVAWRYAQAARQHGQERGEP